jgi:glucarate dehydratase
MLRMSSVLPNLSYAADAHYHPLGDDAIVGGKLAYRDGAIEVPAGPGSGVDLDREKLGLYSELFKSMGGYQYDRDPERPRWFALVPDDRWQAVS